MSVLQERIKPAVSIREFFTSPYTLVALTDNVYNKAIQALSAGVRLEPNENDENASDKVMKWHLRRDTTARMPACSHINYVLFRELGSLGIYGELHKYQVGPKNIEHVFVNIPPAGEGDFGYLVDFAYKQFIPVEPGRQLPDYMIIPYNSPEDVKRGLEQYHVRDGAHHYYLRSIFEADQFAAVTTTRFNSQGAIEHV